MDLVSEWKSKIEKRELTIGVIGVGYVGLPLLLEFAKAGFSVIGFDIDPYKVERLNKGESYIHYLPADRIRSYFVEKRSAHATTNFQEISRCDAIVICVPTPLDHHREPDLTYIKNTGEMIGPYLRSNQLVVLESTTYPGTTEEILIPIVLKHAPLKIEETLFVAYSPEREDPGNPQFSTSRIPKVVGGIGPRSLELANLLYSTIICQTVPVSSVRVAEATKLVENIFRAVNIAMVNELKMIFTEMGIDIWEVIEAAKTKPFGFMPFYPGPGLGGHCIPIDPFYLTWKAREYGMHTRFIELAGEINTSMPDYVIQRAIYALNQRGRALKGTRVLLVGIAYKKNVDDDRESPSYRLWSLLLKHGAIVSYYDPYIPEIRPSREYPQFAGTRSLEWEQINRQTVDMAIVATAHDNIDFRELTKRVSLVIDTRNVCPVSPNVVKA